jgi:hypothetical protein
MVGLFDVIATKQSDGGADLLTIGGGRLRLMPLRK